MSAYIVFHMWEWIWIMELKCALDMWQRYALNRWMHINVHRCIWKSMWYLNVYLSYYDSYIVFEMYTCTWTNWEVDCLRFNPNLFSHYYFAGIEVKFLMYPDDCFNQVKE